MLGRFLFRLIGWKLVGQFPYHLDQFVLIVIPHTSYWDFPIGILARSALGAKITFIGKKSLFRWPFGILFRWMGGYPVDRSKSTNFVQSVVDVYRKEPKFIIVMSPEGTRSKVQKLKSGFYYIAKGANVPVVMCKFDFSKKEVGFAEPFMPPDTFEETLPRLEEYYRGVVGKRNELNWLS